MNFLPSILFFCGMLALSTACFSKFKSSVEEEYVNATMICVKDLKISTEEWTTIAEEMKRNADVDDKCMAKCVFEKLEMVGKDGLFDRDALFDFLEDNAPKPLLPKMTEIVNKCADSTGIDKLDTKEGITTTQAATAKSCKTYQDFNVCVSTNSEKLC